MSPVSVPTAIDQHWYLIICFRSETSRPDYEVVAVTLFFLSFHKKTPLYVFVFLLIKKSFRLGLKSYLCASNPISRCRF